MGQMMGGAVGPHRRGAQMKAMMGYGGAMPAQERQLAEQPQAKLRQIGSKTFFYKNGRWVDSTVTPEEDSKAVAVIQFSEDYFRLARAQKAEYNQYLSQSEPVTVKLDGKVYHIDPAPAASAR